MRLQRASGVQRRSSGKDEQPPPEPSGPTASPAKKVKPGVSSGTSGGNGSPDMNPNDSGDRMDPNLRRLLVLLVEFGGIYGTIAVVVGAIAGVDPFGGLHWDQNDALLGLKLFAPIMLLDAVMLLPEYASRAEAQKLLGLAAGGAGGDAGVQPEGSTSVRLFSASAELEQKAAAQRAGGKVAGPEDGSDQAGAQLKLAVLVLQVRVPDRTAATTEA